MPVTHTIFHARAAVIISFVCLNACASFPSKHSDPQKNHPSLYKIDMRDCADAYPETPDGVYIKQRIACMKLKGWQ